MIIIVMGVSGSGKSTIGKLLADKLNLPFYDADDFHPISNIQKMKSGIALEDADRKPWLELLNEKLRKWSDSGAVLACSALKESYREILTKGLPSAKWVYLFGTADMIASRIVRRRGHYMPPALLESQLKTLEEPEYGIKVDVSSNTEEIVTKIIKEL